MAGVAIPPHSGEIITSPLASVSILENGAKDSFHRPSWSQNGRGFVPRSMMDVFFVEGS